MIAHSANITLYLECDRNGRGYQVFAKLGFTHVGQAGFDLSKHGSYGTHVSVAMIRDPQRASSHVRGEDIDRVGWRWAAPGVVRSIENGD